jgi:hypothetical protein
VSVDSVEEDLLLSKTQLVYSFLLSKDSVFFVFREMSRGRSV